MLTFEEVFHLTKDIGSAVTFEAPECKAYFDVLMSLPEGSDILEIGGQFGRSSSIALQVAKEKGHHYYLIDPFIDPPEAIFAWCTIAKRIGHPFVLICEDSKTVPEAQSDCDLDCVLVDGNHWEEYVKSDIDRYVRHINPGGYALFHDYGYQPLPHVYPTVNAAMVEGELAADFDQLPTVGTLGIFRRKS
jgi:predicted O-methyltransferase YrrM